MYITKKNNIVIAKSSHPIKLRIANKTFDHIETKKDIKLGEKFDKRITERRKFKVAVVCNWNLPCGISTYTGYLVNALKSKVSEIKIFSEKGNPLSPDSGNVIRCWERGKSLKQLSNLLVDYNPDYLIIQHEFGIFPNACHFLNFLQSIGNLRYSVVLHSVYEHLDKTVCTSNVSSCIVHSDQAKKVLQELGHKMPIAVIPHGCMKVEDTSELWNIFHNPYSIVQFGFGFHYKGVDRAIEAISLLKKDSKFKDIFYCYLCSENPHTARLHDNYVDFLREEAVRLGVEDNVTILRGYQDEKIINNYLRTAKLAIFPYKRNPDNVVYGASGAIRIGMANRIPLIASESHLFDDLEGIVPRPDSASSLSKEIDEVFSNDGYRKSIVNKVTLHTSKFTWDYCADKYLEFAETLG